jgi:TrmH family RNA methyltransferase
MELSQVEVVLVRPRRAENVAAACRAMKNMGLRSLWIVDAPRPDLDAGSRALAYGAWDVLDAARCVAALGAAVGQSTLVVGTSGRAVAGAWTARQLGREAPSRVGAGRVSLVFGPEATGLTRSELDLCHERVHVPTDPAQPSLNLAQAVLLVAYEVRLALLEGGRAVSAEPPEPRASAGEIEQAIQEMREALLEVGYLDPASPDRVLAELRRLLARAGPSPRETSLLRGLARQMAWAGRVARGRREVR